VKADPRFVAAQIDALDHTDPEAAHNRADDVLLANVDPLIADAYKRLVERCEWWASA